MARESASGACRATKMPARDRTAPTDSARLLAFDLLFTDVVLGAGMNGGQLADEVRKLRPELQVLYTSGYSENAIVHHGRVDAGIRLLTKPYRRADLARMLRQALEGEVVAAKQARRPSALVRCQPLHSSSAPHPMDGAARYACLWAMRDSVSGATYHGT